MLIVNSIKQNTEPQIEANKEVSMEVDAEKTKYMAALASHQNADQYHSIKIAVVGQYSSLADSSHGV
jgi:CTP synthase (UTP-ammonia lyase)